jgi:hypothetical protein
MSDATSRVISGKSWEDFCDGLKAAGEVILRPETPATEIDRAEGFRYLSRLTRAALERMVEFADPDFPVFYALSHETIKIGSDNPDNTYRNCIVDGAKDYRVHGFRGTAPMMTFGTKAERYAIDGTQASTGELDSKNMKIGPDGAFEIVLSAKPQPGNWLKLAADSSMLIVRETHFDRKTEVPARMTIEQIAGPAKPQPLTAADFDSRIAAAAAFVNGTAKAFAGWMEIFLKTPNDWTVLPQSTWTNIGGDPNIFYLWAYWKLAPDEALVIDTGIPECDYWNCQLNNYWDESLDYRYTPVHINNHTARYNDDCTVTVVIAAKDPGVGNFLDTAGHDNGCAMWRWVKSKDHPIPKCRVVKLAELKAGGA